ncbi:hypothetical protein [Streptomyces sp. NPDC020298]|uniref:hypothetical protein n=1 Tax=unclassified Streptomyces TaxID=2593676 RepID=UPI0033D94DFB
MRRALAAVCAALTVYALVTACSGSSTSHGRVLGKTYRAAQTTWTTQTRTRRVCTTTSGRRSRRTCSSIPAGMRRVAHRTPECWELRLDTGLTVCVTAARWSRIHVGDHI